MDNNSICGFAPANYRVQFLLRNNKDMETKKVIEQFHYFNIQADVDSVYGNWAVSVDGDVVNCLYPYVILAIHFKDADWMEKMKTKVWFKPECEEALSQALKRAKEIVK